MHCFLFVVWTQKSHSVCQRFTGQSFGCDVLLTQKNYEHHTKQSWFGSKQTKTVQFWFIISRRFSSEKFLTLTVGSFFRQTTDFIAYVPLFTETDKTTQAKSGQCKLSAKAPPFIFNLLLRNLQNQKRLKGPPFQFFFGTVRLFSQMF